MNRRVTGATINLPFISFAVEPEDLEQKVAREVIVRLADKRVLTAFECCDDCVERAIASLMEIRSMLVNKQVELSGHADGGLFLLLELMLEGIRQFFTFVERLQSSRQGGRRDRRDLQPYFDALTMLRGHMYQCRNQIAVIAGMEKPAVPKSMCYEDAWQLESYEKPNGNRE
ncbi:hypothetical protein [Desulfosarcina widdelii]|uniref:hypothetical protein n=1 Tax=Desulfosarcina widdelii TaxID=947919 RepID=UPI0012D36D98|nr:hypothetical protein [Desulfosarcina widdelii]